MKKTNIVVLWILSLMLLLLIVQNTALVRAHFLWFTADVPVIVLLVFAVAGGFVAGIILVLLMERGVKKKQ